MTLTALLFLPSSHGQPHPPWHSLVQAALGCGVDRVLCHEALQIDDPALGREQSRWPWILEFGCTQAAAWQRLEADGALTLGLAAGTRAAARLQLMQDRTPGGRPDGFEQSGLRHGPIRYMAAYEGDPADADAERAWQAEYLSGHVPLMRGLPRVRGVQVFTRIEFEAPAGLAAERWMLRNVASFDTVEDLSAALASTQRRRLYEHRMAKLPPLGQSTHAAYRSHVIAQAPTL